MSYNNDSKNFTHQSYKVVAPQKTEDTCKTVDDCCMGEANQVGPFADTEFKCKKGTCCGVGR